MALPTQSPTYNYPNFRPSEYDFSGFAGLEAGGTFKDAAVTDIDAGPMRIGDLLNKPLVLEMGSITCPMYAQSAPPMQHFVSRFPELNFAVLYVREAHPGEKSPAHQSTDEKVRAAAQVRQAHGETRRILVDDVEGEAHQVYGSMPNSIYIIDRDGVILFRSIWNNTNEIEAVLTSVATGQAVTSGDMHPIPPFGVNGIRTLALGGWVAFRDFLVGLPKLLLMHRKAGNL